MAGCHYMLDKYLVDVYDREIKFDVSEHECEQIEQGVDTIVWRIFDDIAKGEKRFTIQTENLLKVGSFSEKTKICYPDEFDYIAVFPRLSSASLNNLYNQEKAMKRNKTLLKKYSWYLKRSVTHLEMQCQTSVEVEYGTMSINTDMIEQHGPANKLCMNYVRKGDTAVKIIQVDITPAIRIDDIPTDVLREHVINNELLQLAMETGSHLMIFNYDLDLQFAKTFTETELDFIQNIMSDRHKMVFKILKYLVNGKHTTEMNKPHVFSSYSIKTMMFQHHFECTSECALSVCVLKVLKQLLRKLNDAISSVSAPALKGRPVKVFRSAFTGEAFSKQLVAKIRQCKFVLRKQVQYLENGIEEMKEYKYEDCRVVPLIDYF